MGYDNSNASGTINFTGVAQGTGPDAKDFSANVLQNSVNNTLDTVANSVNFTGPVTVTIETPPAAGVATVNGNNTINYNATNLTGPQTLVYRSTSGAETDTGTITIIVDSNSLPLAPDANMEISTRGAAPGAGTVGNVNVALVTGYDSGNLPSVVSILTTSIKGSSSVVNPTFLRFTPNPDFFAGTTTFGYQITDGNGDVDAGVITVIIPDDSPTVAGGPITTNQDTTSAAAPLPSFLAMVPWPSTRS